MGNENRTLIMKLPLLTLAGAVSLVLQSAAAFAADAPDTGALGDVVVTAQRRTESIQDVPLAITAVNAEDLARAGISDIRDLGNTVPGLTFTTQGPFASATIRGVQSMIHQAGADMPVAIYVDGVYENNHTTSIMELADVEQVEVLKGPQGTLYGRNATAGAIVIKTVDPQYTTTGKIQVDYGEYTGSDQRSGDTVVKGYIAAPIVDQLLAFSLSGYYRDMQGFLTNDNTGGRSGDINSYTVRGKLLFEPASWAHFLLMASKSKTDDLYSGSTTALNGVCVDSQYSDGICAHQPWHVASDLYKGASPIYSTNESVSLKADFSFPGVGNLTSVTAHTKNTSRYEVDLDTGTSPTCHNVTFVCLDFVENTPNTAFQQEFTFASEKFGQASFLAGASYFKNDAIYDALIQPVLNADGSLAQPVTSAIGFTSHSTVYSRAWSAFLEFNYDFTAKLHAIAGARYSKETTYGIGDKVPRFPTTGDVKASAVTPRVSLRYDLTDSTNMYVTFSKGFKTAVIAGFEQSDIYAKPESIKSYEVGLKTQGERYRASTAVFYYDYTDMQSQFWNGTGSVLGNAQTTKMAGMEAEGSFRVTSDFLVSAGLSLLPKAEYGVFSGLAYYPSSMTQYGMTPVVLDMTGQRVIKSPKMTANVTLSYTARTGLGEFVPSLTVYHSSEYWWDVARQETVGAYSTVAASVAFRPAGASNLDITLWGRNLGNKAYYPSTLLGPTANAPVYAPPREIGLGASYKF